MRIAPGTWLLLFLSVFFSAGCIRTHLVLYLLPDGSGKLTAHTEYGRELEEYMIAAGGDSVTAGPEGESFEDAEQFGVVGWTEDRSIPQTKGQRGTLYFDNINELKIFDPTTDSTGTHPYLFFRWQQSGAENVLVIADSMLSILTSDPAALVDRDEPLPGFALRYDVTVPGRIEAAQGFDRWEGREASFATSDSAIAVAVHDGRPLPKELSLKWKSAPMTQAEIDAFRREIEEARKKTREKLGQRDP